MSLHEFSQEKKALEKTFLTLDEIFKERATRPETKYLYAGIKEKSFGIVFGPSKSGKTIYCENLALSLAIGRKDYLGQKLDGIPQKVLFISLEEYWINRADRNRDQLEILSPSEIGLAKSNYLYQKIEFAKYILNEEEWESLESTIISSEAEIVFIDSLTRMNPGELEKSKDAEKIMKRLRDICYSNSITLFIIHHSRKGMDQRLTMDSIKGSSVFTQETDFAIGIAKTSKNDRYIKEVYYRYAQDDKEFVQPFAINKNKWIEVQDDELEDKILSRADRRIIDTKTDYLLDYINQHSDKIHTTGELIKHFESSSISERKLNYDLKELETNDLIQKPSKGKYASLNFRTHEG